MSDIEEIRGKKVPWPERMAAIAQEFPSTIKLDWDKAFREDMELFGRVFRDILKVDQNVPGRSGPRPVLKQKEAIARLRQFMGVDYSELDFEESFRALAFGKSIRNIASQTGLDRNMVQKLLNGSRPPDIYTMEVIAKSFKKSPSFFKEYRVMYILGAMHSRMEHSPEITIDLYKRFKGQ